MADRATGVASVPAKPAWVKQAEEAKLKSEAEKAAAAKAAFEATFKAVDPSKQASDSEDDADEEEDLSFKPIGPPDPSKCLAAGAGIAGGTACAPSSFVVTAKDSDGRRVPSGSARVRVKISPGVGVGGADLEGMVKDQGDGTYTVTYAVPKRGNYMVHVELDGHSIMGSPFPVFFSAGTVGNFQATSTLSQYPNMVNQTMPNMPNYAGSVSGAFPGLLGMIPGSIPGPSGGVVLPGIGASLGEVCREHLGGRCGKTDCKFNHPPHNTLMNAITASTTLGTLSQAPMAPSAAAMAAAHAIMTAKALQAQVAQMQAEAKAAGDEAGSTDKAAKEDALKRTLQVSNLSPLLTVDQLKQLFGFCGTVVDCIITESKHFSYIEYSKPEEATTALALNNMDVGGRPLNVEMAKSLPSKPSIAQSSLPLMIQQAVAMQQMNFQQALLMQQTIASQQAANRAATVKSATEMASARAAEISKKLQADGVGNDDNNEEAIRKSKSPPARKKSKSRSRSPIIYRRSRRSRSYSPLKYSRDRRSSSPFRSHYLTHGSERSHRDVLSRGSQHVKERSRDHYSSTSRRHRSKSLSPRTRKSSRADSRSPKRRRESLSPRVKRLSRAGSRSPRHHRGSRSRSPRHHRKSRSRSPRHHRESRSSPRRKHESTSHRSRRSRSRSAEEKERSELKEDVKRESLRSKRSSRAGSRSPRLHHRSKSSPGRKYEKTSKRSRHSRSRSAEGRHHFDNNEGTEKSEKQKQKQKPDQRKTGIDEMTSKIVKDCAVPGENSRSDNKRSFSEDGSVKNERNIKKYKEHRKELGKDSAEDVISNVHPEGLGIEVESKCIGLDDVSAEVHSIHKSAVLEADMSSNIHAYADKHNDIKCDSVGLSKSYTSKNSLKSEGSEISIMQNGIKKGKEEIGVHEKVYSQVGPSMTREHRNSTDVKAVSRLGTDLMSEEQNHVFHDSSYLMEGGHQSFLGQTDQILKVQVGHSLTKEDQNGKGLLKLDEVESSCSKDQDYVSVTPGILD